MFYVPRDHKFSHGKRVAQSVGGLLAVTPPRNGRLALREIFPKAYYVGDYPHEHCSLDVPRYIWEEKPRHTRILFCRNPYARVLSLWKSQPKGAPVITLGKFIEWLLSPQSGYLGWTQATMIGGMAAIRKAGGRPEREEGMIFPPLDPDYIIQVEDLGGGLNQTKLLESPLTEDDVPYVRLENEGLFENLVDDWRDLYEPIEAKKVRLHYEADFELCGYPRRLEDA